MEIKCKTPRQANDVSRNTAVAKIHYTLHRVKLHKAVHIYEEIHSK